MREMFVGSTKPEEKRVMRRVTGEADARININSEVSPPAEKPTPHTILYVLKLLYITANFWALDYKAANLIRESRTKFYCRFRQMAYVISLLFGNYLGWFARCLTATKVELYEVISSSLVPF